MSESHALMQASSKALVDAREVTLLDLVDRAVDHGVILAGDITIAVADIDLIYVGLQVLLASVERVQELSVEREKAVGREVRDG
jgi:gas vesicle structural protein